jgi:hypothetical protein
MEGVRILANFADVANRRILDRHFIRVPFTFRKSRFAYQLRSGTTLETTLNRDVHHSFNLNVHYFEPGIDSVSFRKAGSMTKPRIARNGPGNGGLTAKQEATALALAAGFTQQEAAKKSGAGARTIKAWLATQPAFNQRIREMRSEMTSRALGKLADQMGSAAETLNSLHREATSESVRLSAARSVIELGTKLKESVELEERIADLESKQPELRIRNSA